MRDMKVIRNDIPISKINYAKNKLGRAYDMVRKCPHCGSFDINAKYDYYHYSNHIMFTNMGIYKCNIFDVIMKRSYHCITTHCNNCSDDFKIYAKLPGKLGKLESEFNSIVKDRRDTVCDNKIIL